MDKKLQKAVEKGDAGLVSKLVSNGARVTGEDKRGNTLLHLAAMTSSVESCGILIAGGCNPKKRNKKGETPFMIADSKKKHKKVAQFLKEQEEAEDKKAAETAAAAANAPTPTSIASSTPSTNTQPRSVSSVVNVLTYDINASNWVSISEEATLSLNYTPNPFGFVLSAPSPDGGFCVNDKLDPSFVFSKSTDDFYNYRLGEGPIFGFQFLGNNLQEFTSIMDNVKEWVENPPAIQVAPEPTPPAGGPPGGPPAPPPIGDGPPPPPPMDNAPISAPVGGGGLASMLAAKKDNLADSTIAKPETAPPPQSGGNMMSELQNRLKRRSQKVDTAKVEPLKKSEPKDEPAKPPEPKKVTPSSIAAESKKTAAPPKKFTPSSEKKPAEPPRKELGKSKPQEPASGISDKDMELFKDALLTDFRAELNAIKTNIIASLQYEIASAYSQ